MKQYHKIQTVFHRSPESNYKELMEGAWALPEFEMLQNIEWVWTEKIDGTNIRIKLDGYRVSFGGKSDDAQIPAFLLNVLAQTFTVEKMAVCFGDTADVCLYGEGYGAKIQKGGNYIPDGVNFILFDCKVGNLWLSRENVADIAKKLDIKIVPVIGTGSLKDAVDFVKKGYVSTIAANKEYVAEGLIMKPRVDLLTRNGERVVAKIKHRDFKR